MEYDWTHSMDAYVCLKVSILFFLGQTEFKKKLSVFPFL